MLWVAICGGQFKSVSAQPRPIRHAGWPAREDDAAGPGEHNFSQLGNPIPTGGSEESEPHSDAAQLDASEEELPAHHHPGAVLGDAPTAEEFTFAPELEQLCKKSKFDKAVWMLPLSFTPDTDPRDFLLTQTSDPAWVKHDQWMTPHWKAIRPWLTKKKSILPQDRQLESCALVGTSGNLLKTYYGPEIDRHDAVFRFNLAPAGGTYADFVGEKTNFRAMNAKQSRTMAMRGHTKTGDKLVVPWDRNATIMLYRHVPKKLPAMLKALKRTLAIDKQQRPQRVVLMDRRFLNHTTNLLHQFQHCRAQRQGDKVEELGSRVATAGLAVVLNALHLCKHVTTYGIGDARLNSFTKQHFHYFKDTSQDFIDIKDMERRNITYNGYGRANREAHEFNLEYEMLTAFAKASVLRHCTSKGCEGKDYPWAEEDAEEDGGAPEALVEYEGQRVADSPTPKNFSWESAADVVEMCRAGMIPEAVKRLPLSYSEGTDPKGVLFNNETSLKVLKYNRNILPYWPSISPYVTHSKADFFGEGTALYDSCAIVGGSGGLLKANYGPEIDRHSAVFRFNLAPSGGEYAEFAGSRTDFRLLNNVDSRTYSLNGHTRMTEGGGRSQPVQWDANATLILSRIRAMELKMRMKMFRRTMRLDPIKSTMKVGIMDKRYLDHASNFLDAFRVCKSYEAGRDVLEKGDKSPSSGLVMAMTALHLCKHVTMYGIADKQSTFIRHHFHYFKINTNRLPDYVLEQAPEDDELAHRDRGYGHANTIAHSFELERDIFLALADANLLRHCTWEGCTGKELPPLEAPKKTESKEMPAAEPPPQENAEEGEEQTEGFALPLRRSAQDEWDSLQRGEI